MNVNRMGLVRESVEDIFEEINEMVGLEHVKMDLQRLLSLARVMVLRRERDLPAVRINMHMVFSGPPGTGKTEMARKVSRLLKAIRLLKRGHLVEVDRSQLVASYVGQTATKTKEKIDDALDGVLFIDEAYTLTNQGSHDTFGQESVDTLLRLMENYRERLVVIIAGYTEGIKEFIESNAGLKSRFSRFIHFSGYEPEELLEIFKMMVKKNKMTISEEAMRIISRRITEMVRESRMDKEFENKFGNAREVRGLFETVLTVQAERLSILPDIEEVDDNVLQTITSEDAHFAVEVHEWHR